VDARLFQLSTRLSVGSNGCRWLIFGATVVHQRRASFAPDSQNAILTVLIHKVPRASIKAAKVVRRGGGQNIATWTITAALTWKQGLLVQAVMIGEHHKSVPEGLNAMHATPRTPFSITHLLH
jgi:hypothetical protein